MAKGVSEIQNVALFMVFGIQSHHFLLVRNAPFYPFGTDGFGGQHFHTAQLLKQLWRCNERVLDHLSETTSQLRISQGAQKGSVGGQDAVGLAHHTDAIFDMLEVDARFAAHRSINHGQQGGGTIHHMHPALEGGRGKTAHVTNRATTEQNERVTSVHLEIQHPLPNPGELLEVFSFLSGRNHQRPALESRRQRLEILRVETSHIRVGQHHHAARAPLVQYFDQFIHV